MKIILNFQQKEYAIFQRKTKIIWVKKISIKFFGQIQFMCGLIWSHCSCFVRKKNGTVNWSRYSFETTYDRVSRSHI